MTSRNATPRTRRSRKQDEDAVRLRRPQQPLPFSGREKDYLYRMAAVVVFVTFFLIVGAHLVKSVVVKISETHAMSTAILKSSTATNTAVGALVDSHEETVEAIDRLAAKKDTVSKEIKQLGDSVKQLRGSLKKKKQHKQHSSYDYNQHYPVIGQVMNGHK